MQRIFDQRAWWERIARRRASTSVVLLCLLLVAAMWVGLLLEFNLERERIFAGKRQENENLAAVLEQHVARTLRAAELTLEEMGFAYRRGGGHLDLRQFAAGRVALTDPYHSLGVVDDKGNLVLSTTPTPAKPLNFSTSEAFQTLREQNSATLYIGKPRVGSVTGKLSLFLGRRITKPDGSFGGFVALALDPGYFTKLYDTLALGADAVVMVVGRDGVVRARATAAGVSAGENVAAWPAFSRFVSQKDRGSFVQRSLVDGVTRIMSSHGLHDYPLIVAVGTSLDVALADFHAHQHFYVAAAAGVSLLVLGLGLLALFQIAGTQRASEAHRISEERFALAAEASSDGIWDWNIVTGATYFSDRWFQLLGYTRDELDPTVETWISRLHPDEKDRVLAAAQRHLDARAPFDLEYRLRTKSGADRWFHASGQAVWDAAGRPLRMAGSLCDVTERRHAEEGLRASEAKYRMLIEQASDAIFIADRNGTYTDVNARACDMLGYSREELIGLNLAALMDPDEARRDPPAMAQLHAGATVVRQRLLLRKDGTRVPVELSARQLPDGLMQGIARDLTERYEQDRNLRQREAQFRSVFEQAAVGIAICDTENRYQQVNEVFCQMTGYSQEELRGRQFRVISHPDDTRVGEQLAAQMFSSEIGTFTLQKRYIRKDGSTLHALVSVAPMRGGDHVEQSLVVAVDITARVQADAELTESRQRLADAERIAQLGNWELDLSRNELSWSDEIFRIFEIDKAQFAASYEAFLAAIHPEDRAAVDAAFQHSVASREPYELVHRLLMQDGRIKHVRERGVTDYDADGQPLRTKGTVQDVTSLVLAEEATRRERDFAASLITTAPAIILVLGLDGRIEHINPYMEQLSGYRLDEVQGQDWFDTFLPERERERIRRLFDVASAGSATKANVNPIVTRQGAEREIEWYDRQLFDGAGQLTGLLAIGLDVTERRRTEQALEESRELFSRFMKYTPIMTYMKDEQGVYTYANAQAEAAMQAITGKSWLGKATHEVLPPEAAAHASAVDREVLAGDAPDTRHETLTLPEGVHHYLTIRFPINLPDGRRLLGGQRLDISEQKRAEEEVRRLNAELEERVAARTADLRVSEARYRVLVEALNEGLGQVDPQGRIVYVNAALCRMLGYTRDELTGQSSIKLFDAAAQEGVPRRMALRAQGNTNPYEISMRHKDGHGIDTYVSPIVLKDDEGNIAGSVAVFMDLTALRRAERELAASRDRLQYLLGASPAVIYAATPAGATFVGDNVRRLLGYAPEELLGHPDFLRERIHPQDLPQILPQLEVLAKVGHASYRYRIKNADGQWRWLRDSCRATLNDDGTLREVVGLWQDITDLVDAELELEQTRDKLLVSQKMATIGQLTATVSHELRNPLGTIRTSIFSLNERYAGTDATLARTLGRIERNVVRCDNIINDLLDFSRTRERRAEPTPIESWLLGVVADIVQPDWLQVEHDLHVNGLVLTLDQERFRRAIINVVENAIQAMEPGAASGSAASPARLSIGCRTVEGKLVVTVTDSGPGMTPETLARVFEPLFSTKTYGVGLGLATVKQMMLQERGDIQITSQPQLGTQVTLWLPLNLA